MSTEWICHCIRVTFTVHWLTSRVDEHSSGSDIRYNSSPMEILPNSGYSQFSTCLFDLFCTNIDLDFFILYFFLLLIPSDRTNLEGYSNWHVSYHQNCLTFRFSKPTLIHETSYLEFELVK